MGFYIHYSVGKIQKNACVGVKPFFKFVREARGPPPPRCPGPHRRRVRSAGRRRRNDHIGSPLGCGSAVRRPEPRAMHRVGTCAVQVRGAGTRCGVAAWLATHDEGNLQAPGAFTQGPPCCAPTPRALHLAPVRRASYDGCLGADGEGNVAR